MTLDATMVGVPAFANNGPRTEKVCWALNPSKLQPITLPLAVQIVVLGEMMVFTSINGIECVVKRDGKLLKLKRVETPVKTFPVTREDLRRTRSAAIEVPDDAGFRRTSTSCPTIRSGGGPKASPVVSTGRRSAYTKSLSKGVAGEVVEYL